MVIGLLMIAAIPTVTGVAQAISAQKTEKEREKDANRMKKFHIDVECDAKDSKVRETRGHRLVLKNDRVWVGPPQAVNPCPAGYVAQAFYIEYPDTERIPVPLGLVSQVTDDPPLLNWIYVDKDTMELKYGNKSASITHIVGPWDWTEDESAIMFDELESFTAVEDPITKKWQVYVDMRHDSLEQVIPKGSAALDGLLIILPWTRATILGAATILSNQCFNTSIVPSWSDHNQASVAQGVLSYGPRPSNPPTGYQDY